MEWSFPVAPGTPVEVRLYFANQYDGTANVGGRVFDVSVEGNKVLDDYDIVADTGGTQRGTVKRFNATSDGTINVLFEHVTENPLINAIEIVRTDLPPGPQPGDIDFLGRRLFNVGGPEATSTVSTPGFDWGEARGAFVNNDVLYVGRQDGTDVRPQLRRTDRRCRNRGRAARGQHAQLQRAEHHRDVLRRDPPLLHGER